MLRPYHVENNGSLPITEIMQRRDLVSILMGDRLEIPDDVMFLSSHILPLSSSSSLSTKSAFLEIRVKVSRIYVFFAKLEYRA